MKTSPLLPLGTLLVFLTLAPLAQAQTQPTGLGYWNVETNLTTRDYTIVRFYNDQDQLVYEETLLNVYLDLGRRPGRCRRIQSRLDLALQQVLQNPAAGQNPTLLAQQFSPNSRPPRPYAAR
ncbi:hypothetical protein [Hymenobacter metallicola]|uniref:Uncharacterized protein n=1 Tax=Hymenobacter metallicola TaxID=2563114 RepID=A0A4Z0PTD5_9BACT|nr:hypothetical protein [Hymenobacter metallicola]TGE20978.1 hypothetical protein E5K02_24755 [Hymenobacter metallicola]